MQCPLPFLMTADCRYLLAQVVACMGQGRPHSPLPASLYCRDTGAFGQAYVPLQVYNAYMAYFNAALKKVGPVT